MFLKKIVGSKSQKFSHAEYEVFSGLVTKYFLYAATMTGILAFLLLTAEQLTCGNEAEKLIKIAIGVKVLIWVPVYAFSLLLACCDVISRNQQEAITFLIYGVMSLWYIYVIAQCPFSFMDCYNVSFKLMIALSLMFLEAVLNCCFIFVAGLGSLYWLNWTWGLLTPYLSYLQKRKERVTKVKQRYLLLSVS